MSIKNYIEYWIPTILWKLPSDFDTIVLRYISDGERKIDVFHWKKINNIEPSINNPNVFPGSDAIILDKYIELIKINSVKPKIE